MQNERKPDLNGPEDEAAEERVDAMMDPRFEGAAGQTSGEGPEPSSIDPATAPLLADKQIAKEPAKVSVEHQKEPDDLTAAIEETNKQLAADQEVADETEKDGASEPVEESPLDEELNDPKTSEAIDDIVAQESDEVLAAEDAEREAQAAPSERTGLKSRITGFLAGWWHNPASRWLLIGFIAVVVIAAGALPATRYATLNALGVRSGAVIQVIDQSTLQPLPDVTVRLADQTGRTDGNGKVKLEKLRLGTVQLVIEKRAFAPINQTVTIGWGSNPLGEFKLSPAGSQYAFALTDYLSNKPVSKAVASAGEADANADEKGKIKLTLEPSETAQVTEVTIKAPGYRDEKVSLDLNSKQETALKLVPARKAVFISKRSGKYDVYKIDLDGKNEELVLAGTGTEREDITLVPHLTDDVVAMVSTRDDKRNSDGYLLSTLTLLELKDNTARTVTQSEQVKIVNWLGDRLVYVQIAAGTSAGNPNRQRLMSYDYKIRDNKQLASANYFNDVLAAGGKVYYAPSNPYAANQGSAFLSITPDGAAKQQLLNQETWNLFRTSYDNIVVSAANEWYDYKLGASAPNKLQSQPGSLNGRVYIDSPDSKQSLWVDNRDGKGALLVYDIGSGTDKVLRNQSGLKNPVRWLNDKVILYRINTDQETADYALSLDGGEPVKIKDVTNTGSVDRWYYY